MSSKKEIGLDFQIDKLTRSIENVVTGDSFPTDITRISTKDLKLLQREMDSYSTGQGSLLKSKKKFTS